MTTVASNAAASKLAASAAKPARPAVAKPAPPAKPAAKAAAPAVAAKPVASTVSIGAGAKASLGLYTAGGTTAAAQPQAALAAGAGGVIAGGGHVVVDIESSDSGYDNKIYYSTDNFKTMQYIGVDNKAGSVDLGAFAAGTQIRFGIDNGQGNFFKTGAAAENADNVEHARMAGAGDGAFRIGFEDLRGGGDRDFNDAIIKVRGVPAAPVPAAAAGTNHSGLGDGTNPGQGAGAANSPNQGAANPGGTSAPAPEAASVKPAAPVPAKAPVPPVPPVPAAPAKPVTAAVKVPAPPKATTHAAAKPAPHPAPAAAVKDNRSGLGDGTNPGHGIGTVNSPNTGTLNPGGIKKA